MECIACGRKTHDLCPHCGKPYCGQHPGANYCFRLIMKTVRGE